MVDVCVACEVACEATDDTVRCEGCGRRAHFDCVKARHPWRCESCTLEVNRCVSCLRFDLSEECQKCTKCKAMRCGACRTEKEWVCDSHACGACGAADADAWRCVRCPAVFCRGCRPAASLLIAARVIKCVSHLKETLPPIDKALFKRRTALNRAKRKRRELFPSPDEPRPVRLPPAVPKPKKSPTPRKKKKKKMMIVTAAPSVQTPQPAQPPPETETGTGTPLGLLDKLKATLSKRRVDPPPPPGPFFYSQPFLPPPSFASAGAPSFVDDDDEGLGLPTLGVAADETQQQGGGSHAASILDQLEAFGY